MNITFVVDVVFLHKPPDIALHNTRCVFLGLCMLSRLMALYKPFSYNTRPDVIVTTVRLSTQQCFLLKACAIDMALSLQNVSPRNNVFLTVHHDIVTTDR